MKPFLYSRPDVEATAVALAAGDARFLAGGMTLLPTMKQSLATPAALVDLSGLPRLVGVSEVDGAIEIGANLRSRWLGMPYGDQAIFVRASTFRDAGGYAELPVMEDFDLVRRLKRRGRVRVSPLHVITSARRWRQRGPIRTTIRNQLAVHAEPIRQTIARKTLVVGLRDITKQELEQAVASGNPLQLRVLGLVRIADDVSPRLARAAIGGAVIQDKKPAMKSRAFCCPEKGEQPILLALADDAEADVV